MTTPTPEVDIETAHPSRNIKIGENWYVVLSQDKRGPFMGDGTTLGSGRIVCPMDQYLFSRSKGVVSRTWDAGWSQLSKCGLSIEEALGTRSPITAPVIIR
jgi:hypothetical protein